MSKITTVHGAVDALLQRAGLVPAEYDISELSSITTPVRSLYLSQVASTRVALEMLAQCYFFLWLGGDKITARMRGAAPAATIPWADLGADGSADCLPLRQTNDIEVPAQLALTYDNIDNDYQPDTQYSDRLLSDQVNTETLQVPLGFTAAEAKAIVEALLLDRVIGMTTATIAVGRAYSALQCGDVVLVLDADGNTWRMLIVKIEDTSGVRKLDLRLDDATVWTQSGTTTGGTQGQSTVLASPATTLELLDIPLLTDSEDRPGIYAAVTGSTAAWTGAGIYDSVDGTTYTLRGTINDPTAIGTCTTVLGSWSGGNVFDETNTVTVNVGSVSTLSSYSRDEILTGAAPGYLVGSELLYARTAALSSPGVYVLSGLLRGRRGTEWAMAGHGSSERFVRLSYSGLRFFPLDAGDLAGLRYYKGVSSGQRLSAVTAETVTPLGITLKPFAPVDARVDRSASDHVITWRRRTRLSTRLTGALPISCPLGEASEAYEVEIFAGSAQASAGTPVLRTLATTSPSATYTSAMRTADGTGSAIVYLRVYQLSADVGRGYPLITSA